jgi:hypothetical protein
MQRRARKRRAFSALGPLLLIGCGGLSADPGVGADLQVAGAQFVRGALPSGEGPSVVALDFADRQVPAGAHDRPLIGQLAQLATAVAIALDGDRGYFIVGAGVPSTDAPTLPTFDTRVSFARRLATATRTLSAVAVDGQGHFGAPTSVSVVIAGATTPPGALVVHLQWSGDADLDLHVIDPSGAEIWNGNFTADSGALDVDSNARCNLDLRDQENVVWASAPPSGHYLARVDAFSLCGDAFADWTVQALVDGSVRTEAVGTALDGDTRGPHAKGAGVTALEFDVP